ncbi:ABC transporter permease [Nocardioides sp. LHG3406-4]|uniref:ABC transporter permease n=1 Tax=Nocardioides sp. LHG3406-4 TaxID=2804575 RepID=UPI003CE77D98
MQYVLYIVRRLAMLVPVLFGITLVVFLLVKLVPGDPAVTLLGTHVTDEAVAALHEQMGLDQPWWHQYLTFLGNALQGDLGDSYQFRGVSVSSLVFGNLAPTVWLVVAGVVLAMVVTVPLAMISASRPGGAADGAIRVIPLVGIGLPSFWVGIMLVLLLGLKFPILPVSGFGDSFASHLEHIVLPAMTVALIQMPILIRSLRASLIEVLASDYVVTARAKGLGRSRVLFGHALRNASVSTVTVLGVNLAYLVGATVAVEKVFALNGIGYLMYNAILGRDLPVIQGVTLVFAVFVVLVNLATDLAHAALDPRVRIG